MTYGEIILVFGLFLVFGLVILGLFWFLPWETHLEEKAENSLLPSPPRRQSPPPYVPWSLGFKKGFYSNTN